MSVSLTWGGVAMPIPRKEGGIEVKSLPIAASRRTLSGSLKVDVIAVKTQVSLRWSMLTSAQRATLRARYDAADSAVLILPDGRSFAVIAVINSWQEDVLYGVNGQPYYNVSLQFEEV